MGDIKYEKKIRHFWSPEDHIIINLPENYQEYSKSEKIGKIADWMNSNDKKSNAKAANPNLPAGIHAQAPEEDENFFDLNNSGKFRGNLNKNRAKYVPNRAKPTWDRNRIVFAPRNNQTRGNKRYSQNNRYRQGDRYYNSNYWFRRASIAVKDSWKLIDDFHYSQLSKLQLPQLPDPVDVHIAGGVLAYDRSFDFIKPKEPRALKPCDFVFHKVPTCDDPIIRNNVEQACVFASDSILSTLMTCTRSVAPWDIVIHRVANLLFLDKRPESDIELLSVNETALDPGFDHDMNSPTALSLEATAVNQYYSQQCLLKNTLKKMPNENPFFDQDKSQMPSVAYKYRVFDLGSDIKVLVRCEFDAYSKQDGKNVNVKSLLEWGTKPNMSNWREEFETQSGSILATEIKNNSPKFAKWTVSALMAGDNLLKIGMISRNRFSDHKQHTIIGSIHVASRDLSHQIGLNMHNAWGIVFTLSQTLLKLPEGRYVLMKDPYKASLRLYNLPDSANNSGDELEEAEDDDVSSKQGLIDSFAFEDLY